MGTRILTDDQIKKLVDRAVAKALRGDQAKTVNEIVGPNPDEPGYGGGKFHAACNASGAKAIAELRDKAVRALNSNPAIIISPFAEESFRQKYGSIHDLDMLIAAHRDGHRVR